MPVNQREPDLQAIVEELGADLDTIRTKVDALGDRVAAPADDVGRVFAAEVRALVGDALPDSSTVRRAARLAVAEQAWTARLGTLLEARDVVELLLVSKQRVSTLARQRRLIALPQDGRMRFPAWQFAVNEASDRETLAAAHRELVDTGALSPWAAASWFGEEHAELDGRDPVAFLRQGGARSRMLDAARRDAARLAQ
jgi:hypothetical protein